MFDIILVIVLLIAVGALLTENSLYLIKRRSTSTVAKSATVQSSAEVERKVAAL